MAVVERVSRSKKFVRPCQRCKYFRRLTERFGVCDKGEHPSDVTSCREFKRRIEKL